MIAAVARAPNEVSSLSPRRIALQRALRHGSLWLGGGIMLVIVLAALLAPVLTPHDPTFQDLGRRLILPV